MEIPIPVSKLRKVFRGVRELTREMISIGGSYIDTDLTVYGISWKDTAPLSPIADMDEDSSPTSDGEDDGFHDGLTDGEDDIEEDPSVEYGDYKIDFVDPKWEMPKRGLYQKRNKIETARSAAV